MPISIQKQKQIMVLKRKAYKLHKQGYSSREIAEIFREQEPEENHRTHAWIVKAIQELKNK